MKFRRRASSAPQPAAAWRQARFCVVDVETTGLDLRRDEVVSIGSVRIESGRIDCSQSHYRLIKSPRPSSVEAVKIHCIRDCDAALGMDPADAAARLAEELQGCALVAHAAWIERAFLRRLLGAGAGLPSAVIDTAALARAADLAPRTGRREPGLEALATELGVPVVAPHHALGDAMTTAFVFLALVSRLESRQTNIPLTVRTLASLTNDYGLSPAL